MTSVPSYFEIPPLSQEISQHAKYVLTYGRMAYPRTHCLCRGFFDGVGRQNKWASTLWKCMPPPQYSLAVTLTTDRRPWKLFQQRPMSWIISVPSSTKYRDTASRVKGVNGLPPAVRSESVMLLRLLLTAKAWCIPVVRLHIKSYMQQLHLLTYWRAWKRNRI